MSNVQDQHKNLSERFKIEGSWYPPRRKDLSCHGVLAFTPNYGAELEVEDGDDLLKLYVSQRIFWGVSTESQNITLFDFPGRQHSLFDAPVNPPRKDATVGAKSTSTYHFREVFLGHHFGKIADAQLKTLTIKFSYLNEWINGKRADPFAGQTDLVSLRPAQYLPPTIQGIKSIKLQEDDSIVIIAESEGISLEKYRDIIYYVQYFLSLMTLDPMHPSTVNATTMHPDSKIGIFFPQLDTRKPYYGAIQPAYVLFTYGEIKNQFESLLKNFFSLDKLICDLFFGHLYSPLTFIEARFLSLTQAIEAFHRKTRRGGYVTRQWYNENLYDYFANMINEAPKIENKTNFKASLVARMQFGYEYALRKRLDLLLKKFGPKFLDIFVYQEGDNTQKQKKERRDLFIKDIVDTRNYYIHFDEDPEAHVFKGTELQQANERLEIFFSIVLLNKLGIQPSIIDQAIEHLSGIGRFSV